jgi:hypothetical protein
LRSGVVRAVESALAEQRFVSPVDVLLGLGWLAPSHVEWWRQGRIECLEEAMGTKPSRIAAILLEAWAGERGLEPRETDIRRAHARSPAAAIQPRGRRRKRALLPHALGGAGALGEGARPPTRARSRPPDLVVVSPLKDWSCHACGGSGDLLLMEDAGPLCMACAEMDHLVFLPAGDAALTRRAKLASELSAVVVRFSRSRRRYERQGVLVEPDALARAQSDTGARTRR